MNGLEKAGLLALVCVVIVIAGAWLLVSIDMVDDIEDDIEETAIDDIEENNEPLRYWKNTTIIGIDSQNSFIDIKGKCHVVNGMKLNDSYIGAEVSIKWYNLNGIGQCVLDSIEVHGYNESIIESKKMLDEYLSNIELSVSSVSFTFKMNEYGIHTHQKATGKITVTSNRPLMLKTHHKYFDRLVSMRCSSLPSDLNNKYFVVRYPDWTYEAKSYDVSVEIYGSGSEQAFFPKTYNLPIMFKVVEYRAPNIYGHHIYKYLGVGTIGVTFDNGIK